MAELTFSTATGWTDSGQAIDGDAGTFASVSVPAGSASAPLLIAAPAAVPDVLPSQAVFSVTVRFLASASGLFGLQFMQTEDVRITTDTTDSGNISSGGDWGTNGDINELVVQEYVWHPVGLSVGELLAGFELSVMTANTGGKSATARLYTTEVIVSIGATPRRRLVGNPDSLNAEADGDAILTFAEVSHPLLSAPLRVVTDVIGYRWKGVDWHPVMFEFEAVNDNDRMPEARINLPAIDQTIAKALIALPERAKISVWSLSSADFDLTTEPREQIGTPVPLLELLNYELMDVQGTASEASGRIMLRDYTQEPWPGIRATQSRLPGLFT